MSQLTYARRTGLLALSAALLTSAAVGCNQDVLHPAGASPVVSPDSEEGKRAIAESEALVKSRQAQEAKVHARARKRNRELPKGE